MRISRLSLFSLFTLLVVGATADAHFLFVHVGPAAEAGRFAEVYFSDLAEAGDPRYIEKIKHTKLWVQQAPGEFQPLVVHQAADRLRARVPVSGSLAVVGVCEYGVLARPKATPFLLRHFPKAVAGNPEELNRLKPTDKVPLEIVATFEKERIHFVALRNGKPAPKAEFWTLASDLSGKKHVADAEGRFTWTPPRAGKYSVYTSFWNKTAGKFCDKDYGEIRDFATLAFSWPPAPTTSDPAALALFDEAVAKRARWNNFPGFRAHAKGQVDGRPFHGTIWIDSKGEVSVEIEDEAGQAWVTEQLESIALHRMASDKPSAKKTQPVMRFGDFDKDHPLGRLVVFDGGRMASSYRVKDQQLLVVNRHLGKEHMTITVQENERTAECHFLPRHYSVQYWDTANGKLLRTETFEQRWQRLGSWDLPTRHAVAIASEAGLVMRTLTLSKHELSNAKK
jgi:hypothetical protein